jgi:outer membrane protein assembly factor BamB
MYIGSSSLLISLDKDKNHRWTYDSGNEKINFRSSPAINENNRLMYIGTKNNEDSQLLALNIDTGKLEWSYNTDGDVYSSPALYNGLIYACAERGYMHILKEDGTLVQKIAVNEEITWPSPVIDKQGVLYIAGMGDGKREGYLYAIKTITPDEQ